ncbi:MAG: cobalt transporter CbiM [Desulfobacterales bacterium]|jgi:cobalt/nickel transport system permease protein
MHISEGVLSGPVLLTGAALGVAGTALGLKRLDYDRIPQAGILSAAFFVASLVHVPLGPSNVHLILNGVVGLLLGWVAVPVILVGLVLHAVFFQFGGITTLGVNTVIMALPAVVCHYLFAPLILKRPAVAIPAAFGCGLLAVLLSGLIVGLALVFSAEGFLATAGLVIMAHIPVMLIEGIVTVFCVSFLKKVQPAIFQGIAP